MLSQSDIYNNLLNIDTDFDNQQYLKTFKAKFISNFTKEDNILSAWNNINSAEK